MNSCDVLQVRSGDDWGEYCRVGDPNPYPQGRVPHRLVSRLDCLYAPFLVQLADLLKHAPESQSIRRHTRARGIDRYAACEPPATCKPFWTRWRKREGSILIPCSTSSRSCREYFGWQPNWVTTKAR